MNFTLPLERFSKMEVDAAFEAYAKQLENSAEVIGKENPFASHVTDEEKSAFIKRYYYDIAAEAREHRITSMAAGQALWRILTSECVALQP